MKTYYHYTNIAAFYGIVSTNSLWFSSMSYMNDEMEGLEFRRVLELMFGVTEEPDGYGSLNRFVKLMSENFLPNKYLFSSTQLRDDISQWRAYTTVGQGVCFGFHDGFILDETIKKLECIYELDSKKEYVLSRTKCSEYFNSEFSDARRQEGSVSGVVESCIVGMEYFKHESFSPEREIRWIDDLASKGDLEVHYRPHRLGLMPYRLVSVDLSKISEVILGPQVPKQNIITLKKVLNDFDFRGNKVVSSLVTLR